MSTFEPPNQPPPPPPGGYGGPPPPPPGGYGGPPPSVPGPGGQWDLGAAVSYGWSKFQANAAQLILAALAIVVGVAVIVGLYIALTATLFSSSVECSFDDNGTYSCDTGGPGFFGSLIISGLFVAVILVYTQVVGAGLIRGALNVTAGQPFRAADVFSFTAIGPVVVTSLIIGAAVLVGFVLCYVPGIIVSFATSYSLYFVIDKNLPPVEAIKASVNLVKDNLGSTIVWFIIAGVITGVGAILCGVGLLVAYPVTIIGTAYTYKVLTGQSVAA